MVQFGVLTVFAIVFGRRLLLLRVDLQLLHSRQRVSTVHDVATCLVEQRQVADDTTHLLMLRELVLQVPFGVVIRTEVQVHASTRLSYPARLALVDPVRAEGDDLWLGARGVTHPLRRQLILQVLESCASLLVLPEEHSGERRLVNRLIPSH